MRKLLALAVPALLIVLAGCSGRPAAELYSEGRKAEEEKNFTLALELYNEAVTNASEEAYAESSMYRIVMLSTNVEKDRSKVLAEEQRFLTLYPTSENAPTVMFMMAFMYNNEMHSLDSARHYYQTFLGKWPEHELAVSARFELENLGKSPEEYIRGTVASTDTSGGGS
jgi:outer membrane protein assembly factor BamD (BamD/ComL family)